MADIELVIKIPEKWFNDMVREEFTDIDELCAIIQHGIILPKGHGRLIDENDLDGEYVCSLGSDFECISYCSCSECISSEWRWNSDVSDAPTIIEADN